MKARVLGKFKTKEEACLAARLIDPDPVTVVRRGSLYYVLMTEEQEEEARLYEGWEKVDPKEAAANKCSKREYALATNVMRELVKIILIEQRPQIEASMETGVPVDRIARLMKKYSKGYLRHLAK